MATKEPEVKHLFTKTVARYEVAANAQFDIFQNPQVTTHSYAISANYCPAIQTVRLFVGGADNSFRNPIAVDGGDYEAVVLALADLGEIVAGLPHYEDADDAVAAWKAGKRSSWQGGEHTDSEA